MDESKQDYEWDVVYHMDGHGLSDWLNDFNKTNKYHGSQHGERVWTEDGFEFDKWSDWCWNCSYYFNGLIDSIEQTRIRPTEDDVIALLVHGICSALGLLKDNARKPKYRERFLFC
jgi:hypothetical protein